MNDIQGTMPNQVCNMRPPHGLLATLEADCNDNVVCHCCTACFGSPLPPSPPPPTHSPTPAPTTKQEGIIASVALLSGAEFGDVSSYQSRALSWSDESASSFSNAHIIQRYALACIFYATYAVRSNTTDDVFGEGVQPTAWFSETNWLSNATECSWYGISCDENGQVTDIELVSKRLTQTRFQSTNSDRHSTFRTRTGIKWPHRQLPP